ncbi:hypothetical protein EIN_058810 [Entamoeba invadens IP1]|uniref:hypothetical protein n=1 Tax=Entamoeba invadens IP1 TaxID=370355 RepID=UPI0002C3F725|nr:hypothetical protein EIN_058810 [Entamoeba invadens IP1]ELP93426.1 hypothetical protein EIN_058810 [Entamoeba invadens IP1]|eukprot:XP_004260197.1 hypothetical protein EIN_058810 [Entamoeba invadens IP1]
MTLSSFKPVARRLYEVIDTNTILVSSSSINEKKPRLVKERKYKKKRWDPALKAQAVKLAEELGLTHATNHLQKKLPDLYSDLCPSTLQYWVQQANSMKKTSVHA